MQHQGPEMLMPKTLFGIATNNGNYESRKVADQYRRNGLVVSTAYTFDAGYETAIRDADGVHVVDRYPDRETAVAGHEYWSRKVDRGVTSVIELSDPDGVFDEETVLLNPKDQ